ncbi:Exonuclease [Giardia muris]|uniref:Exonuclease n=1 Tax=Giardia muris TaxID=5742 RepID=A0A4Z1T235_GIAMU|nr:Exonuclease [Giardia muris]|eukprot:TNJ27077.1 Exonuclease [Giardia muris]
MTDAKESKAEKRAKGLLRQLRDADDKSEVLRAAFWTTLEEVDERTRQRLSARYKQEVTHPVLVQPLSIAGTGACTPGSVRESIMRCLSFKHPGRAKSFLTLQNEFSCSGVLFAELVGDTRISYKEALQRRFTAISLSQARASNPALFATRVLEDDGRNTTMPVSSPVDLLLVERQLGLQGITFPQQLVDTLAKQWNGTLLALDCEMVSTETDSNSLARATVLRLDTPRARSPQLGKTIYTLAYDALIQLEEGEKIIDYKTKYSGITEELLTRATNRRRKHQMRRDILKLIAPRRLHPCFHADEPPETFESLSKGDIPSLPILVGHSINNDLRALGLRYPLVIDTAILYQFSSFTPRLADLASSRLSRAIQQADSGHDSKEDAEACMDLVLLRLLQGGVNINSLVPSDTLSEVGVIQHVKHLTACADQGQGKGVTQPVSLSELIHLYNTEKGEYIAQYYACDIKRASFKLSTHYEDLPFEDGEPPLKLQDDAPLSLVAVARQMKKLPHHRKKLVVARTQLSETTDCVLLLQRVREALPHNSLVIAVVSAAETTIVAAVATPQK